jgi:hypothetical protein
MYLGGELAEQALHDVDDVQEIIRKSEKDKQLARQFARIASNIISATLLHSFSGESAYLGATREELIMAVVRPDDNINDFDYVLDHYVAQYAARLAPIGNRYMYGVRNPESELKKWMVKINDQDAWEFIEERVKHILGSKGGVEPILYESTVAQLCEKKEKLPGKNLKVVVALSSSEPQLAADPDSWLFKDMKDALDYQNTAVFLIPKQRETFSPMILENSRRVLAARALMGNVTSEKKGIEHSLEIIKSTDDRFKYQQKLKELDEVLSYVETKEREALEAIDTQLTNSKWHMVYARKQSPSPDSTAAIGIEPLGSFSIEALMKVIDKTFGPPALKEWICLYLRSVPGQQAEYSVIYDGFHRFLGWPSPYSAQYDDVIAYSVEELLAPRTGAEKVAEPCSVIAVVGGVARCKGEVSRERLRTAIIRLGRAPPPVPEFEADFTFEVVDEETHSPIERFVVAVVETSVKANVGELKQGEILKAKIPKRITKVSFRISAKNYETKTVSTKVNPDITCYKLKAQLKRMEKIPISGVLAQLQVVDEKTQKEVSGVVVIMGQSTYVSGSELIVPAGKHEYEVVTSEDYCHKKGSVSVDIKADKYVVMLDGKEIGTVPIEARGKTPRFLTLSLKVKPSKGLVEIPYGNPAGVQQQASRIFQDKTIVGVEIEVSADDLVAARNVLGSEEGLDKFNLQAKYKFQGDDAASLAQAVLLKLAPKNWAKVKLKAETWECE